MKLLKLQISNVLGIIGASVNFDGAGNLVVIGGDNGAGKSSFLSAIEMLVSGGDAIPSAPIRQGSTKGEIIGETEDFIARRILSASGPKLEIKAKDGSNIARPQELWDRLTAGRTLDPCEFMRMKPREQLDTLRGILGIDFTALDAQHSEAYQARTVVNRNVKTQQALADAAIRHPGVPKEITACDEIISRLEQAQQANAENQAKRDLATIATDAAVKAEATLDSADDTVQDLRGKLKEAEAAFEKARTELKEALAKKKSRVEEAGALVDVEIEPIKTELRALDATNDKVRANLQWQAKHYELVKLTGEAAELTKQLEAIEKDKEQQLEKAKFPIAGLAFTSDGVIFGGLPFEQACTSDQIRISFAMACALAPKLKVVLIREGSLIGPTNLKLIEELATANGAQVIMERVSTGKEVSIVMEEGQISDDRTPAGKAAKQ